MNRSSDFRQKEVINISDGKRLGFVSDVEIDLEEGKIDAIFYRESGSFSASWEKIMSL